MRWSYDELMVAASRAGKAVVTGDEELFSLQHKRMPHVTLGACFNFRGDAPPPLLDLAGPQCALSELGTLHKRWLRLTVNNSGWVDRCMLRQWCKCLWGLVTGMRRQWGLEPAEPAILVLDNASSRADLEAMQWLRANHIHVVTLPPHLTHHAACRCLLGLSIQDLVRTMPASRARKSSVVSTLDPV
jgi:hypothetical protein